MIDLGAIAGTELQGGWRLAAVRASADAALLSTAGTLLFDRCVARSAVSRGCGCVATTRFDASLRTVARASAVIGLAALGLWLVVQSAAMADGDPLLPATVTALRATWFGHLVMAQAALLSCVLLCLAVPHQSLSQWGALAAAAFAVLGMAGHGHLFAMSGWSDPLIVGEGLHVAAAAAWLGGLLPLLLLIRAIPERAAAAAARTFSRVALAAVVTLAVTAAAQGSVLIARPVSLVGTAYGWAALGKSLLFALLLGFAWVNRFRLVPALAAGQPGTKRRLLASLAAETAVGLGAVLLAAVLSGLEPAMHLEPTWPFPYRPDPAAFGWPAARHGATLALAASALAVLLAGAALLAGRFRLVTLGMLTAVLALAHPALRTLFVPASVTSYYRSPTGFAAESVQAGAELYAAHCTSCHGAEGRGDGAAVQPPGLRPADLNTADLWTKPDGALFALISGGLSGPAGKVIMPPMGGALDPDQIWALIDYVRAHAAGIPADAARRPAAAIERAIETLHLRARARTPGLAPPLPS